MAVGAASAAHDSRAGNLRINQLALDRPNPLDGRDGAGRTPVFLFWSRLAGPRFHRLDLRGMSGVRGCRRNCLPGFLPVCHCSTMTGVTSVCVRKEYHLF